jgi:hypothetical protein
VIRRGGWTAGSGRYGWPRPARPRPAPAGPDTSGSTGCGSSPRMRSGLVTKCGYAKTDVNASWSSYGSLPSVSAHLLPLSAISTTARPARRARKLPRRLCAIVGQAVRPNATGAVSRSCSGGRPNEPGPGTLRRQDCYAGDTPRTCRDRRVIASVFWCLRMAHLAGRAVRAGGGWRAWRRWHASGPGRAACRG